MGYLKGFILLIALFFFALIAFLASLIALIYEPISPGLKNRLNSVFLVPFGIFARWLVGVKLVVLNEERLHLHRPMIFFGNHQSGMDLAVIGSVCTDGAVIVGKKEIQNIPLFGWFWKIAGNLLINRSKTAEAKAQIDGIRNTLIAKNLNLAIFPEGTRSKSGEMLPFKKGVFYMAASTGLPLVPVVCSKLKGKAVWENFELSGGHIVISVLEPIYDAKLHSENLDAFREEVRGKMVAEYDRINALAEEYDRNPSKKKAESCC
jgi:1-acyl-sn-glycerol-3-phosphate acyltransferase